MRSIARPIVFVALVGSFSLIWMMHTDPTGPRRQFVIRLSGRGEIEVAGGQKVAVGPGHINLIEDTTGKGHITRNLGTEDRIAITIPLADQTVAGH